jgi:hypothetical protein
MFPKIMTKLVLKLFRGCTTEIRKENTEIRKDYSLLFTLYSLFFTLYSLLFILYSLFFNLYSLITLKLAVESAVVTLST